MRINYFGILLCAMALSAALVLVAPVACDMIELFAQPEEKSNCDPLACSRLQPDQTEDDHFAADEVLLDSIPSSIIPCRQALHTL